MTGSYKPRHLKEGYFTCVTRSISRLRPPLHARLVNRTLHVSHTMTIVRFYPLFPTISVLLGGVCQYVHFYG